MLPHYPSINYELTYDKISWCYEPIYDTISVCLIDGIDDAVVTMATH